MYLYIRSMSESKNKIYSDIASASKQIDQHIIRLMLYPNSSYRDHWMHEIWTLLHDVDTLKSTHKFPKKSFIFNALSVHNDILKNYVKLVVSEEEDLEPSYIDLDDLLNVVESYQDWLSEKLSSEGVALQKDVKSKLIDLLHTSY